MSNKVLPRILIIDDFYGRKPPNPDREDLCLRLGLKDITGDEVGNGAPETIPHPLAEAVFCRGQVETGGSVENDLPGTLEVVRKGWEQWPRWALVLLDLEFKTGQIDHDGKPEGRDSDRNPSSYFGLTILEHVWKDPGLRDIPVVILSSMKREAIERRFADQGVWAFIDKTEINRDPLNSLLMEHGLLEDERIIGRSLPLLKCLREARKRARLGNDNILLLGETGTGKELFASYLHKQSGRKGAYVPLFTSGVPETLIDDRLFGHVKGAFDGAYRAEPGAAELADGGTLFIDEFGEIPATIQTKFLRLLDKNIRETQRIGSQSAKKLNLQVVLATNRLDILSSGAFRQALLSRVGAKDPMTLPPLRERAEDIPLLVDFFVKKYEKAFGAESRRVSEEALEALKAYSWPGNVRELEGVIERAVDNYRGLKYLSKNHLNIEIMRQISPPVPPAPTPSEAVSPIQPTVDDISALIQYLEAFTFHPAHRPQWEGKLSEIEGAYARLMARYLESALEAAKRRSEHNQEVFYTFAMKLITGDTQLKPTKAKRLMKDFLSHEAVESLRASHPILHDAYEIALGQRPARQNGKGKGGNSPPRRVQ